MSCRNIPQTHISWTLPLSLAYNYRSPSWLRPGLPLLASYDLEVWLLTIQALYNWFSIRRSCWHTFSCCHKTQLALTSFIHAAQVYIPLWTIFCASFSAYNLQSMLRPSAFSWTDCRAGRHLHQARSGYLSSSAPTINDRISISLNHIAIQHSHSFHHNSCPPGRRTIFTSLWVYLFENCSHYALYSDYSRRIGSKEW